MKFGNREASISKPNDSFQVLVWICETHALNCAYMFMYKIAITIQDFIDWLIYQTEMKTNGKKT